MRLFAGFVLSGGLCVLVSTQAAWMEGTPSGGERGTVINELRIDQSGDDLDEYFELAGTPGTFLDGLTYLVLGDDVNASSGIVEAVVPLDGYDLDADGLFLVGEETLSLAIADLVTDLNFENSDNVTHLLVEGFSGALGDDLDTNDDGVLDILPWTSVLDAIGLLESDEQPPVGTEWAYGAHLGFEDIGPDGPYVPGQAYRCDPDGYWVVGQFDLGQTDRPGEVNVMCGDTDGDGWLDVDDNCPYHYNPGQEDCDNDGIGDVCAIADGLSEDCNANDIPDECDIDSGYSDDYDLNGVPDECDPDCNDNQIPDACDVNCDTGDCINHPLGCGNSEDLNANGIPDECEVISDVVINEIHADPDPTYGDANHDGVSNYQQDEFVEIVNDTGAQLDMSGWELHDFNVGLRHVFPSNTVIEDLCAIVIFGGGDPAPGTFGGATVQTASTGQLGLNNAGDTVSIYDSTQVLRAQVEYGSEGGDNQSLTRDPDITGVYFVKHSEANGS
ncbi:MAG: lamin tail domain-containing protein, partial [Phycisphaerales bacterium]